MQIIHAQWIPPIIMNSISYPPLHQMITLVDLQYNIFNPKYYFTPYLKEMKTIQQYVPNPPQMI